MTGPVAAILSNVTSSLVNNIRLIDTESFGRANVLVIDYYEPIPPRADFVTDHSVLCTLLKANHLGNGVYHQALIILSALNKALDDGVKEANKLGYAAKFDDIASVFGGLGKKRSHGMCTAHPWVFTGSLSDAKFWRAVHPTATGQAATALRRWDDSVGEALNTTICETPRLRPVSNHCLGSGQRASRPELFALALGSRVPMVYMSERVTRWDTWYWHATRPSIRGYDRTLIKLVRTSADVVDLGYGIPPDRRRSIE